MKPTVALTLLAGLLLGCASQPAPELRLDAKAPLPEGEGRYRVLLPPGASSGERFPVLYFLHDYFGDSGILWRTGVAAELERRMAAGELRPFILVAPEGDKGYWSDFYDGSRRYETWVAEGLRAEVETQLPARQDRGGRALAGISMGGFGAVKLALRRPELYASAGSLSGALLPLSWQFITEQAWPSRSRLKRIFGRSAAANNAADNDLRALLGKADQGPRPGFYLRCGTEDKYHLDQVAQRFAAEARQSGFEAEIVLEPGGHNWKYWRASAVELIAWHAARFEPVLPADSQKGNGR